MGSVLYEEVNRANYDQPHIGHRQDNLCYVAHVHEEVEIVYIEDGEIEITVSGVLYTAKKGDLVIVLPFEIHSLETKTSSQIYVYKLLSAYFDFTDFYLNQFCFTPQDAVYTSIMERVTRLTEEAQLDEAHLCKRLAIITAADEVLLQIARLTSLLPTPPEHTATQDSAVALLKKVNSYLEMHYHENITLKDAAKACYLSTYYFAHSFKLATGTTFGKYLNRYRLEQARVMITTEALLFADIASACGFPSVRTFNRLFHNYYKITPSEARREWKKQ